MDASFRGSDNKVYHLSEPTLGDYLDSVPLWVQFLPYERFQKLKGKLPDEDFARESARILQECSSRTFNENSPEVKAMDRSTEGVLYLIYLSLERNHPGLTLDDTKAILTASNFAEASVKYAVLSGNLSDEGGKKKLEELKGSIVPSSSPKVPNSDGHQSNASASP